MLEVAHLQLRHQAFRSAQLFGLRLHKLRASTGLEKPVLLLFLHLMQLQQGELSFLAGLLQLVGAALQLLLQSGHLGA